MSPWLKVLPKIPIPLANGPSFGRELDGLKGEGGGISTGLLKVDFPSGSSGGLWLEVNKLIGLLHGVSGMFLLKPNML
jgi:hypothetical protein